MRRGRGVHGGLILMWRNEGEVVVLLNAGLLEVKMTRLRGVMLNRNLIRGHWRRIIAHVVGRVLLRSVKTVVICSVRIIRHLVVVMLLVHDEIVVGRRKRSYDGRFVSS